MFTKTTPKTPLDSVPWYGSYRVIRGRGMEPRPGQENDHDGQDRSPLRLHPRQGRLPLQPVHLQELRLPLKPHRGRGSPAPPIPQRSPPCPT